MLQLRMWTLHLRSYVCVENVYAVHLKNTQSLLRNLLDVTVSKEEDALSVHTAATKEYPGIYDLGFFFFLFFLECAHNTHEYN